MVMFTNTTHAHSGNLFHLKYMVNHSHLPSVTQLAFNFHPQTLQISAADMKSLKEASYQVGTSALTGLRVSVPDPQRQSQGVIEFTCNQRVPEVNISIMMSSLISTLQIQGAVESLRTEVRIKFV
jgi:hypothetical protein